LQAVHIDSATKAFSYKAVAFYSNIFVAAITISLCFIQSSVHVTKRFGKNAGWTEEQSATNRCSALVICDDALKKLCTSDDPLSS